MAGLDPAIPTPVARPCPMNRDARHKAGHDGETSERTCRYCLGANRSSTLSHLS